METNRTAKTTSRKRKSIAKSLRLAIYIRDGFTCQCCGSDLRSAKPENITLDHITCHSKGGRDTADNMVTCCRKCNCTRQDTAWKTFYPAGSHSRVINALRRTLNRRLAIDIIFNCRRELRAVCC